MINLRMHDDYHFYVDTDDREILFKLKDEFAEYKDGYMFSPKFKVGHWDGKIYFFSPYEKILPYGLLTEFLSIRKKCFPKAELTISDDVKAFFARDDYFDNMELLKCEP